MIAERPTKSISASDEVENLFDGLSFPEVPTAPINAPATRVPEAAKSVPVLQRPESKPAAEASLPVNPTATETKKAANLSALYATEVITSDSHNTMYPELPSFADHLIEENDSGVQSSAYAYNSYSAEQNEETASLLPRQSNAAVPISSGAHMYSNPLVGTREEAPELVTDLVRENSRLADEVANLKRILQDQQQQVPGTAPHAGLSAQPNTTSQFQQQGLQMQQQQQQVQQQLQQQQLGLTVAQNSVNTITGVHVTDTTRPPEKGVKYVCCGGCRQWLMAPRDAVYVVCSTCDSINNCNLAPKDSTAAHTRAAETRALTQRNGNNNNMFWFLDCFSRGLF